MISKKISLVLLALAVHCGMLFGQSTVEPAENKIKWSILICTLESRKHFFDKIFPKINDQIKANNLEDEIEVLYFKDNGENTIGAKRNALLKKSRGTYVCFVDDDDDVHVDYIKMIYEKLKGNPDCVEVRGIITTDGKDPKPFIISSKYKRNINANGRYYRLANHLSPMKREIAIQFEFPNVNMGEDTDWAIEVAKSGLLKKEAPMKIPYYFYLFRSKK